MTLEDRHSAPTSTEPGTDQAAATAAQEWQNTVSHDDKHQDTDVPGQPGHDYAIKRSLVQTGTARVISTTHDVTDAEQSPDDHDVTRSDVEVF